MKKYLSVLLAAWAAGCAVGPDYEPPQIPDTPAFYDVATGTDSETAISNDNLFWQGFDDPLLAALVQRTLNNNHSLQAMLARYRGAENLLRLSRREQWPSITSYGRATDQHLADSELGSNADNSSFYDAGIALNWELDLYGRLARVSESALASLDASAADLQAMQVMLVGQLATSYFELRGMQNRLAVVEHNIALQQSSLNVVESRAGAGRGTDFDVLRARAQLESTRAAVPELRASIRANMHRIAVLTGQSPQALIAELQQPTPLPLAAHSLAVGTPGEVLRNRPDVRAAERRVAAASARIGVATADLFPRFTLSGLIGSYATDVDDLFGSGSEYRRVTLGVDWTFLDRAQVKARIDAADAEAAAQLADYRQTVLDALAETETWLVRHHQAQNRVVVLAAAFEAAEKAVTQAKARYQQGYIDYFALLSSELELTAIRDAYVRSQTAEALAMINVYRTVAGAPESFTLADQSTVAAETQAAGSLSENGVQHEPG